MERSNECQEAYDDGYEDGIVAGRTEGYNDGYYDGYYDGENSVDEDKAYYKGYDEGTKKAFEEFDFESVEGIFIRLKTLISGRLYYTDKFKEYAECYLNLKVN